MKVLLAVDGSKHSLKTLDWVIKHLGDARRKPQIELVTVHLPLPKLPNMGKVIGKAQIERFYREEGEDSIRPAKRKLERAGVPYRHRLLIGPVAETLARHAKASGCDLIVAGTRGMGGLGNLILGSTATKLLHLADRPVLIVR
jgi:nucleotide-binding universal stress UspA family protein